MVNDVRMLDLEARKAKIVESVPQEIIDDVFVRLTPLLQ